MTYVKELLRLRPAAYLVLPVLAATATTAAAQEPRYGHHLLYSQVVDGDTGVVSQVFDAKHAKLNSAGADDFVVPAGNIWWVKTLNIGGFYTYPNNGPATSENVIFYHDKNGKPGKPVADGSYLGIVGRDVEGEFYIVLPPPGIRLKAGTYWLSVQANMDYKSGYWAWNSGTVTQGQSGNPAVWENPANGFHTGCRKFTVETQCWPDGQGPGKYFAIYGGDKTVAE